VETQQKMGDGFVCPAPHQLLARSKQVAALALPIYVDVGGLRFFTKRKTGSVGMANHIGVSVFFQRIV